MITLDEISFDYILQEGGTVRSIDRLSLKIEEGTLVALMGANGSGKSTLIQLIDGILQPSSGTVTVDGLKTDSTEGLRSIRRKVGVLFQNPEDQIVAETVEREIAFGLENLAVPPEEIHTRVDSVLEHFGLTALRRAAMRFLSAGQRQMILLAGVWAMRPQHILCDEATSYLDPPGRAALLGYLRSFAKDGGSILQVTQFTEEAASADRLILLSSGCIIADGAPNDLLSDAALLAEAGYSRFPTHQFTKAELRFQKPVSA